MRDYDMGDFDGAETDGIAGPLIGGGVCQVGTLAAKLLFANKPPAKYAGLIGSALGVLVGGGLMLAGKRGAGLSALITALIVGVPRQLEDLLAPGGSMNGLGVITPEELSAWGAEAEASMLGVIAPHDLEGAYDAELGESPVTMLGQDPPLQLLGEDMMGETPVKLLGDGTFGIHVPEVMAGADVSEISGGFGASWG